MNKDRAAQLLSAGHLLEARGDRPRFFGPAADQAFKRAMLHHARPDDAHVLYDPFCGNGTALVFPLVFHRARIAAVIGSDLEHASVETTQRNLGLCSVPAATERIAHPQAGETPEQWQPFLAVMERYACVAPPEVRTFVHDALEPIPAERITEDSVSVIVTDPPYGRGAPFLDGGSTVQDDAEIAALYLRSLAVLRPILQDGAVACLITARRDELEAILSSAPGYRYRERKRVTGGAYGRNFREIHALSAR